MVSTVHAEEKRCIIKSVKKQYFRKLEKFGLELPKSVQRALEIDRETGTTYWEEAIRKYKKGSQNCTTSVGGQG